MLKKLLSLCLAVLFLVPVSAETFSYSGMATTKAWGRTMRVKAQNGVMPMATAASYCPWSTERSAPLRFSD